MTIVWLVLAFAGMMIGIGCLIDCGCRGIVRGCDEARKERDE